MVSASTEPGKTETPAPKEQQQETPKTEQPKPAAAEEQKEQLPADPVKEKVSAEPAAQPTEKTDKPPTDSEREEKVTQWGTTPTPWPVDQDTVCD